MTSDQMMYDMTIIGGGTAGMYAAYYAGMRDMSVRMIDSLPVLGGTVKMFYPDKMIYDIGGIPKISGHDFVEQMKEQAYMFDPEVIMNQTVEKIKQEADDPLSVTLSNGDTYQSNTILIAGGPGVITKPDGEKSKIDFDTIENLGFPIKKRRITVNDDMQTQTPGIYVAGDMAGYAGKWRLIAPAFTEVVTAVNKAKAYLVPSARAQVYSSLLYDK